MSERTVRRRVLRVYGKLYVRERVDAALYAEHHGLRAIDGDGGVGHPSPA